MDKVTNLGRRLKDERIRLNFTQEQLGAIGGVKRNSQVKYEGGKTTPDAQYFLKIEDAGVDIAYVMTGTRLTVTAKPHLTQRFTQEEIATLGKRLKADQLRLGVTQIQYAEWGGVTPQTQRKYESDERAPDARYLQRIARQGADVPFILGLPVAAPSSSLNTSLSDAQQSALFAAERHLAEAQRQLQELTHD